MPCRSQPLLDLSGPPTKKSRTPIQDACLLGDPSGTGDTTPPYGWMCLGRYGGMNDTCSVPTARIKPDEIFAGQNDLEEKVKAAGPLRGLLTLLDYSIDDDDCRFASCHAHAMRSYVTKMGIPVENVRVVPDLVPLFEETYDPLIRENTLVFGAPIAIAASISPREVGILEQHEFLLVAGAINTDSLGL